jgi:hypothetical protein
MGETGQFVGIHTISAAELSGVLRTRAGLILGPGAIFHPAVMGELTAHLSELFNTRPQDTYLSVGDAALGAGASEQQLRAAITSFFSGQVPDPHAENIARVRWSGVISACIDDTFEGLFSQERSRHPLWQPVTVVSDLRRAVPPRTVPVYKLLGSLGHDDAACSTADFYRMSASWAHVCRAFVDRMQGAPVICLGMSASLWVFWQLLGVLIAEPSTCPSSLILLDEDALAHDATVVRMAAGRLRLVRATVNIGGLLTAVATAESRAVQETLPFPVAGVDLSALLRPYRELVSLVNAQLESPLDIHEVNQLHELLFEPSRPRWDPFVHNLDLDRDVTRDAIAEIELIAKSATAGSVACVIRGFSACGKTTILKRLALDLARAGHIVLWLRPWFYQDTQAVLTDLLRKIRSGIGDSARRVVLFMDDPLTFGTITAQDVVSAADGTAVQMVLVASARTSDWETRDAKDFVGRLQIMADIEIGERLSQEELARLGPYLVKLGIAPDPDSAAALVKNLPASSTRDVLATLYWTLPESRASIKRSVRDEYFRLGDSAGLTKVIVGEMQANTGLLQEAYGLIAVAEHYRSPLPLEVLVAALGVRYDEWLDATGRDSVAWGLFYADQLEDGETFSYRTRNAVVNEIIVRTLNGGELSHGGEFQALRKLLGACTGTSPTYREFCVRVLVSTGIKTFEYEEGLELFDTAIKSLPHPDRTLVHHKGLWIKDKGQDPIRATQVLTEALDTPDYPYTSHPEPEEHIHTSLAATALKAMQAGKIAHDEGRRLVLAHLDKAQSRRFFNPNATHVEARLIQGLIDQIPATEPDRNALLNRALRGVDRALLLLRATVTAPVMRLNVAEDIAMLQSAKDNLLLRTGSLEEVKRNAETAFETHSRQDGFVLAARMLYAEAQASDKGTAYFAASSYCAEVFELLKTRAVPAQRDLLEVALDVYYQWRIARRVRARTDEKIDWERIRALADQILRGTQSTADPFHEYLYALALAHLGEWGQADAMFTTLRRSGLPAHILWTRRDQYLARDGRPLVVQGTVKEIGDRRYLYVEELKMDFRVDRAQSWSRPGETAHAYIEFAFGGATAVRAT